MITILKLLWPYAVAASFGFGLAWSIQGFRITSVEQDFTSFKQELTLAQIVAEKKQLKRQKETSDAWAQNMDHLRRTWRNGWVPVVPSGSGLTLRPATGATQACTDSVPAPTGVEAKCLDDLDRVMRDAAETTLQLNTLQRDIEAQTKE